MLLYCYYIVGGSLEVKLLTIWTDEKPSWAEAERHLDTAQLGYSRTGWSTTKIKPKSAVPWVSIRLSTTSNYYIHDGKSHYISGWDINGILLM